MSSLRTSAPLARRLRRRGFTLLETMLALVIIGVGVLAFVDAQTSFIRSNNWSSQAATGMLLANEIRELTRNLPRHDPVTGLSLQGSGQNATVVGWGRESGEVSIDDLDDLDDFDGLTFGAGGSFNGPIDASGQVITEIGPDGREALNSQGTAISLQGWSQVVSVEKLDPYNFATVRSRGYEQAATASLPYIAVDRFPLRMTVSVRYQGPLDSKPQEITKVTWIVLP
jgi:prepilin-type N-terminal cleavage/methylation domain-containing protein